MASLEQRTIHAATRHFIPCFFAHLRLQRKYPAPKPWSLVP